MVKSSPKYIRKKQWGKFRRIWKTFVTVAMNQVKLASVMFLVSFIIPLSWPEWSTSCFNKQRKIFLKINHQTALRFVLVSELFVLRPYFMHHLTTNRPAKILWLPLQFIFRKGWLKSQLKRKMWNYTSLFWILVK